MFDTQALKKLLDDSGLTIYAIAGKIGISHVTLGNILDNKSIPRIDTIITLAKFFGVTVSELIGESSGVKDGIQTVVIDTKGEELIATIPYKARAGYIQGHNDKEYIEDLPVTILPEKKFKSKTTRCFEIAGDSMEPTLRDRDYVYATLVQSDGWVDLKENRVHILVTTDGIVIKRVLNIKEGGYFFCLSDNPSTTPFRIFYKEVIEVWEARRRMTADFGRKTDPKSVPYTDEFESLESEI